VLVDPIKPTLKAPGSKRLKLKYDEVLTILPQFCFQIQLAPLHPDRGAVQGHHLLGGHRVRQYHLGGGGGKRWQPDFKELLGSEAPGVRVPARVLPLHDPRRGRTQGRAK